ncbi:GH18 domain-containing protein [Plasmodiophora brassicae]|uniref:GH18 domain-containing protein n=1 Tax=Plasmodiophora brassicae TaxID=37360 RepID=A0A0G4IS68_PLABS|nr:hypothetical protein PBRA_006128 [Plasmodiophora brassicae]
MPTNGPPGQPAPASAGTPLPAPPSTGTPLPAPESTGTPLPAPASGGAPSPDPASPGAAPAAPPAQASGTAPSFVFGPYKDVTIYYDANTNAISTSITGSQTNLLSALAGTGITTVTWAFAGGSCTSEAWGSYQVSAFISANVNAWASAGIKYIISTGGAGGSFTCGNPSDFLAFIGRYNSPSLIGVDFDIEGSQTQTDIDNLVQCVKAAQGTYPGLRFSFTVATLGGAVSGTLGTFGNMVLSSVNKLGLSNFYINLMTMDYGSAGGGNCVVGGDGNCDMGASAVQAAQNLHTQNGIPYSQIEITPMIGGNDSPGETFTLADVQTVASFVKQNGLGGVHFWSFDRDTDCAPGAASATCNTYGQAGTLGFTKAFAAALA